MSLIGEERKNDIYPIRQLLDNEIVLGFGADWPVSNLRPLDGIEVAITHRALCLTDDKPSFNTANLINVYEAIKCYTINSAKLLGIDQFTGSLEVGKQADMIILDSDIFEIKHWNINKAKVIMTVLDGEIVYDNLNKI
jgi:predicted amidohydrolase YtcJ